MRLRLIAAALILLSFSGCSRLSPEPTSTPIPTQTITTTPTSTQTCTPTATTPPAATPTPTETKAPEWSAVVPLTSEGRFDWSGDYWQTFPHITYEDVTSGRWGAFVQKKFESQAPDPKTACDLPLYNKNGESVETISYTEDHCPWEQWPLEPLVAAVITDLEWDMKVMVVISQLMLANGEPRLVNIAMPGGLFLPGTRNGEYADKLAHMGKPLLRVHTDQL